MADLAGGEEVGLDTSRADWRDHDPDRLRHDERASGRLQELELEVARLVVERDAAERALERIAEQQPKTLAKLERHGIVFADIGTDPQNWEHIAFSIYTDLCEVDTVANAALEDLR